jgi:DNA invertase Pin-like site-specific DNA recombinase
MKTFGYLRVSGRGQVEGDGPERQAEAITRFCKAHQLTEPVMFFEAGVSGTVEAMDRPKFSDLIAATEALPEGETACIVVERLDRLARDLRVSEFLLAECRNRKIPVYAADQSVLIDVASNDIDPTRTLLRQILGALAEWEKSALVYKLRRARERVRAEKGRCEGRLPYGHESYPEEASALKILEAWRVAGNSWRTMAKWANEMGLKTRLGRPWTFNSLQGVMANRKK